MRAYVYSLYISSAFVCVCEFMYFSAKQQHDVPQKLSVCFYMFLSTYVHM